jgi:hypothetical protein
MDVDVLTAIFLSKIFIQNERTHGFQLSQQISRICVTGIVSTRLGETPASLSRKVNTFCTSLTATQTCSSLSSAGGLPMRGWNSTGDFRIVIV